MAGRVLRSIGGMGDGWGRSGGSARDATLGAIRIRVRTRRMEGRLAAAWAGLVAAALVVPAPASGQLSQTVITGPDGSGQFGQRVAFLPSGDYVVSDPGYDLPGAADVGAVHLYSGIDDSLIATLTGSTAGDQVGLDGSDPGIRVLPNGSYLVRSPNWDQPAPLVTNVGALTWCDGTTGCSGVVSAANSAVGTSASDQVGALVRVLENGNYVIQSPGWDNPVGSVSNAGAVRFCNAATGCVGPLSSANSLVGARASDAVGVPVPLPNGNYVVLSRLWDNPSPTLRVNAGAATFCSGATGCTGTISASNSLVGTTAEDQVGERATVLTDGNYLVHSGLWNNGGIPDAGALTWCSGTTGCTPGPVTAAASLTGATAEDEVGGLVTATPLPGGAYVVATQTFNRPGGPDGAGAITWCGAGGAGCTGATVNVANSLVGAIAGDLSGPTIVPVGSGAFAVAARQWDDPATLAGNVGAVVFCDGATRCQGETPTAANALVGSTAVDNVGSVLVALTNGNYVVGSSAWDDGALSDVGAATFCSGTTGCQGPVTAANSYTGTTVGDVVGGQIVALANGNYVVAAPSFDNGAATNAGAIRLCSGTSGCFGTASPANALVGSTSADLLGSSNGVIALANGNYVVRSQSFDDGGIANVGAVTWCDATSGCTGAVSLSNSLIGATSGDQLGDGGVTAYPDGSYAVLSTLFDNAVGPIANAGAVTFGDGHGQTSGRAGTDNSVIGSVASDVTSFAYDAPRGLHAVGLGGSNRVVIVEVPEPGATLGLAVSAATLALKRRGARRSGDRRHARGS